MEISYRAAGAGDLDDIFQLVENAVMHMEHEKIHQWDSIYPTKEDFSDDIKKNQLYIGIIKDEIVVVYALNKECDEQYKNGKWQYIGNDYNVIHRLCVSPDFQKKGIAHTTLFHIENCGYPFSSARESPRKWDIMPDRMKWDIMPDRMKP